MLQRNHKNKNKNNNNNKKKREKEKKEHTTRTIELTQTDIQAIGAKTCHECTRTLSQTGKFTEKNADRKIIKKNERKEKKQEQQQQ